MPGRQGASLFGIVLYFVFENHGLRYTTASNASLLTSALPIFTLFSEALFFRQRVTWPMLFCLAASTAGVYLLVTVDGKPDFSSGRLFGNELIVGAMACWVVYTILNRKLAERLSSTAIVTFQALASLALFLPLLLPELGAWRALATVSAVQLANLVFLGVCCSAVAYFCYVYAVQRLGATISSAFLNLIPVVTVTSGYVVLQERLALLQVGGMGLVLASLYFLGRFTPAA
jgi:drug/metabolite transporter (DMT)-like permease